MGYKLYLHQMGSSAETLFYDTQAANLTTSIIDPKLKLELSKSGTLEFKILPTHPNYGDFHKLSTYVRAVYNEDELFRGRVLNVEDTIYLERTVTCEGDLAYLVDSLQPPDKTSEKSSVNPDITVDNSEQRQSLPASLRPQMPEDSVTVAGVNLAQEKSKHESPYDHFVRYITNHNSQVDAEKRFRVGSVTIDDKDVEQDFSSSAWRDTKASFDSDLLKYHGGYLQTRPAQDNGYPYIDYLKEPSTVSMQPIMLGVNMVELKEEFKGEDIFTVFVPIGKDGLTIESVNGGNKGIEIVEGVQKYGRIYKSETYSSISNATDLYNIGLAYIDANYRHDPFSVTVKAIDMNLIDANIDSIKVGSIVRVLSSPHNLDEILVCTAVEYDIQNPENNTYDIGDPSETLSQKNVSDKLNSEEETATATSRSGYSASASLDLQAAVNRQAAVIADQADDLYSLTAGTIRINAKTLEIETDLMNIHSKVINIAADDTITVSANIFSIPGALLIQKEGSAVTFGGNIEFYNEVDFWDGINVGPDALIQFGGGSGSTSLASDQISSYYIDGQNFRVLDSGGSVTGNLSDAVVAFGTPTTSGSTVSIPYTTADGDSTHVLTFSKAASVGGEWSSGYYKVYASDDPNHTEIHRTTLWTSLALSNQQTSANTPDIVLNGNNVSVDYDIGYQEIVGGQPVRGGSTGRTGSIVISAANLVSTAVSNALAAVQMNKGSWGTGASGGSLSIGNTANNNTTHVHLVAATAQWTGINANVQIWDGEAADSSHGVNTGYSVNVNGTPVVDDCKTAVSTGLGTVDWSTGIIASLDLTKTSQNYQKLVISSANAAITYPGDTGVTTVPIGIGNLDLSTQLQQYWQDAYTEGEQAGGSAATTYITTTGWSGGVITFGQSTTPQVPTKTSVQLDQIIGSFGSDHRALVKIVDGNASGGSYTLTGREFYVNASSEYTLGRTDANNAVTITRGAWTSGHTIITNSANNRSIVMSLGNTRRWSNGNGTFAITESGTNTGKTITVALSNSLPLWNGYVATAAVMDGASHTGLSVEVDATDIVSDAVASARAAVTLSKSWGTEIQTRGILTVTNTANSNTASVILSHGTITWDGATATIPITDTGTVVTNFTLIAPLTTAPTIDPSASSITVSPDTGDIGLAGVTVNAVTVSETAQSSAPTGKTSLGTLSSNGYFDVASDGYVHVNVPAPAIDLSNVVLTPYAALAPTKAGNDWLSEVNVTKSMTGSVSDTDTLSVNVNAPYNRGWNNADWDTLTLDPARKPGPNWWDEHNVWNVLTTARLTRNDGSTDTKDVTINIQDAVNAASDEGYSHAYSQVVWPNTGSDSYFRVSAPGQTHTSQDTKEFRLSQDGSVVYAKEYVNDAFVKNVASVSVSGSASHSATSTRVGTYSTRSEMDAAAAADNGGTTPTINSLGSTGGSNYLLIRTRCGTSKRYYFVH